MFACVVGIHMPIQSHGREHSRMRRAGWWACADGANSVNLRSYDGAGCDAAVNQPAVAYLSITPPASRTYVRTYLGMAAYSKVVEADGGAPGYVCVFVRSSGIICACVNACGECFFFRIPIERMHYANVYSTNFVGVTNLLSEKLRLQNGIQNAYLILFVCRGSSTEFHFTSGH